MNTRNLSSKKLSLTLLLTVVLLLLLSIPVLSAEVTLLNDGFEISPYLQNWDDNGATNWTPHPGEYHTGHRSVRAVEDADGLLTSDDLDTSDATSIVVDF